MWTPAILISIVVIAEAATIGGKKERQWRHIDASRPTPKTLDDAAALYTHARGKVEMEMLHNGHAVANTARPAAVQPPSHYTECSNSNSNSNTGNGSGGPLITPLITPSQYGADPTGSTDSTNAFMQAMAALTNVSAHAAHPMATTIADLGGATLDLQGGEYLISTPLIIPPHVGNVRIRGGTLRASSTFPADRFLIEIGQAGCKGDKQGVCNEFIGLDNLFLDAAHVNAGCVLVQATMGTTVGPSIFMTGFVEAGLRVLGGHETILSDAWLAEYYWSDKHDPAASKSIAVEVHGQDNYISNVIVFDYAHVGVLLDGAASLLSGVHTWNGGGVGISINGTYDIQDRIVGCYLDYNYLEIIQPYMIIVQDTFFLDTSIHLFPDPNATKGSWRPGGDAPRIDGVIFRENTYSLGKWGGTKTIVVQPPTNPATPFVAGMCSNFVVEDEVSVEKGTLVQTRATLTQRMVNTDTMTFDFGPLLLFPWIESTTYSLSFASGMPLVPHAAMEPEGTIVKIVTASATTATVTVEVAQCIKK